MCIDKNTDQEGFTFEGLYSTNRRGKEKEILGTTLDNKLSFNNHIKTVEKSVEKLTRKSVLPPG